jgi:hypothetical protein
MFAKNAIKKRSLRCYSRVKNISMNIKSLFALIRRYYKFLEEKYPTTATVSPKNDIMKQLT